METNNTKTKLIQAWKNLSPLWKIIGAIITVVTFGYLIYDHIQPKPNPQEAILGSIGTIKERFQPNIIPFELDSISFVNTYKGFQTNVLDVCDSWITLENELSHTEPANFDDYKESSCAGRLELYKMGSKELNNQMMVSVMYIMSLSIESESFNKQSDWKINTNEFGYLTNLVKKKEKIMTQYLVQAGKYIEKGKTREGMMEIDKMKNDKGYLEFDNAFFKYCIQVKECCDHILKDNGIRY